MVSYRPTTYAEMRAQRLNSEATQAAAEKLRQAGNLSEPVDAEFEEVPTLAAIPPPPVEGE